MEYLLLKIATKVVVHAVTSYAVKTPRDEDVTDLIDGGIDLLV